jgi:hypothetical protein
MTHKDCDTAPHTPDHVGFVADKVPLGQVFPPEYFGFPLLVTFHQCSILIPLCYHLRYTSLATDSFVK